MANIKISELNPLLTVEDADVLPIVDNAVTKKVTAAILRSYTQGNSVLLTGAQTIAGIKTFTSQLASTVATGTAPFSVASTTKVTNLNADLLDGLSSADFQATLGGTGIVKSTAGTISYLTDNSTNWNTAFNDSITSAAVTGTTTKTLTLNQQDGGSVTASWTDDNTDAVSSVFGRTGAVVAAEGDYSLTQLSDVTLSSPSNGQVLKYNGTSWVNGTDTDTGLTSVGLSMPSAFTVSNSPLTSNGTLAVTGAGVASQYVRGDGTLAAFPTSSGGGSSVSYYLNGGTNQGTIGGNTYYEMSKDAVIGVGADFTISSNGYIAQFVTDANDPALLSIPGGNWNFEMWFSANSGGGTPSFYLELYKYDGTTLTLISSGSATPESITNGTAIDLYTTALAVPTTALTITDRLAVRVFVNNSGRTITLHTQNGHLCQAITTFSTGLTALNGLTNQVQYFATGTSGTDFGISSATSTHTFNLPTASATNRGALSSADWTTFNNKATTADLANYLPLAGGTLTGALTINNFGIDNKLAGFTYYQVGLDGSANYKIYNSNYGRADLVITQSTGAATFSSSVTASSFIKSGGTSTQYLMADGSVSTLTNPITGTGTTNYLPKFTGASALGNSTLQEVNGNLGLGVTPSVWGAYKAYQVGWGSIASYDGSDTAIFSNTYFDGGIWRYIGTGNASQYRQLNSVHSWQIAPSGTAGNTISFTQAMTLDASGQLGIGTSTPAVKLQVDNNSHNYFQLNSTAANVQTTISAQNTLSNKRISLSWEDGTRGDYGELYSSTYLAITTSSSEKIRITTGGNVLIGTTTDAGYKLDVNGTARVSGQMAIGGSILGGAALSVRGALTVADGGVLYLWNSTNLTAPYIGNSANDITFYTNTGASALILNSAGAATFSSSVTATTYLPASTNNIAIPTNLTNYTIISSSFNGLVVIRDISFGGSGMYLLDQNNGATLISSNGLSYVLTFTYSAGTWLVQKSTGGATTIYFNLISGI
jgi:hypothetical protein